MLKQTVLKLESVVSFVSSSDASDSELDAEIMLVLVVWSSKPSLI